MKNKGDRIMTTDNSRELFVAVTRAEIGALSRQMIRNNYCGGHAYCGLSKRDYELLKHLLDKLKLKAKESVAASLISSAEAKLTKEEYAAFVNHIEAGCCGGYG